MKRRTLLLGAVAGAAGLAIVSRPDKAGKNHSAYFSDLSSALDEAGISKPTLVVDRSAIIDNLKVLQSHIQEQVHYRIVAKSLPSLSLLDMLMKESGSNRLMLFHQPFVNAVAERFPHADVLLGKPMPVIAARNFYTRFSGGEFFPEKQLRWLLDTPERARQYAALADEIGETMQACIEIDVGLHRGGITSDSQLLDTLDIINESPRLTFCGFMGYEPHIVKVPGDPVQYRDRAMAVYRHYVELAQDALGSDWPDDVLLNAGGSPTYQLYDEGDFPFNELATGSCLVKPTDFDIPTLADHAPAAYIATPVLKSLDTLQVPGIDIGKYQSMWNPNRARTFFTYGGYWKARPESPAGLINNSLFGRSTNQEMFNGSDNIDLRPDDWIFLRPTQSEFVFLQFGDIAVMENENIVDYWPVLAG